MKTIEHGKCLAPVHDDAFGNLKHELSASGAGWRSRLTRACSSRSRSRSRLGRSVSGSCSAWRTSAASALRRSVTSCIATTAPNRDPSPSWSERPLTTRLRGSPPLGEMIICALWTASP